MTGQVLENGTYKGITANAWRSGAILNRSKYVLADYFYSDTTPSYQKTGTVVWQNTPSKEQFITLGNSVANDNKMYVSANLQDKSTITGRLFVPATGIGIWDTVAIALRNDQVEYWATLVYGTQLTEKNNIAIMRNDVWGTLYPLSLSTGWYTVKVFLDYQNNVMRMKAWADGDNEPAWQVSYPLDTGWVATQVGFRHYGQGTRVDDLLVIQDIIQQPNRIYLPAIQK